MCVSVSVCVCEEDVHEKREERKSKKKEEKKEKKEKRKKREWKKRENYKLIHTDKQTDRQTDEQTDRRTDRHKSFIDMRYYTEQYSKSNSIKLNKIE